MNSELKDRLLKLLRLSKQGKGGERDNATEMLAKLLAKHGMTMADIDDESLEVERVELTYKSKAERRLIF